MHSTRVYIYFVFFVTVDAGAVQSCLPFSLGKKTKQIRNEEEKLKKKKMTKHLLEMFNVHPIGVSIWIICIDFEIRLVMNIIWMTQIIVFFLLTILLRIHYRSGTEINLLDFKTTTAHNSILFLIDFFIKKNIYLFIILLPIWMLKA